MSERADRRAVGVTRVRAEDETTESSHAMVSVDNYSPAEIASLVETKGIAKAAAPARTTFVLGVLAGAFIGLGAVFATTVSTGSAFGYGPTKWLAGVAFSLGLILVVVAGAELFTGNNLILMSWVSGRITLGRLLRNWAIVYVGNLFGALSIAAMAYLSGWWRQGDGAVGAAALSTAVGKTGLSFTEVFFRGVLANALVCLAVWLATSGRTVVDKVFAIVFPISAFVAAGFEHSIANMEFLPLGMLLRGHPEVVSAAGFTARDIASLDTWGVVRNIASATVGNIVGGAVLVGLVYWFVYLHTSEAREDPKRM
jgi:formate/nitrite transporter